MRVIKRSTWKTISIFVLYCISLKLNWILTVSKVLIICSTLVHAIILRVIKSETCQIYFIRYIKWIINNLSFQNIKPTIYISDRQRRSNYVYYLVIISYTDRKASLIYIFKSRQSTFPIDSFNTKNHGLDK